MSPETDQANALARTWKATADDLAGRYEALERYCADLIAALEWYADDDLYRGHDPKILFDVGYHAREALDGDRS